MQFLQEVRREMSKVTWPTWKETWLTTMMVFIMVGLTMVFFFVVDLVLQYGEISVDWRPETVLMSEAGTRTVADAKWYIVHTYSNFEKKVKEEILRQAKLQDLEEFVADVVVPTEEVLEVRRGQKVKAEHKFLPGYVLLNAKLTDEVYHLVKNVAKVTGFLGQNNKPMPLRQGEVDRILNQASESAEHPKSTISFEIGEQVRVADGPFTSFTGTVEEVDEDRSRVKVAVSIFGRATPVELEYTQVEKM